MPTEEIINVSEEQEEFVEIKFHMKSVNGQEYDFMDTVRYTKQDFDKLTRADIDAMKLDKFTKWKNHMKNPNFKK